MTTNPASAPHLEAAAFFVDEARQYGSMEPWEAAVLAEDFAGVIDGAGGSMSTARPEYLANVGGWNGLYRYLVVLCGQQERAHGRQVYEALAEALGL
jgi:hypothetical protein